MQSAKLKNKKIYGMELILDLFDCDLKILTSRKKTQEFIDGVSQVIKMEKYGPSLIKRFKGGRLFGTGFSFFQFVTTSSITGHFIEDNKIAFINIFSCNIFNPDRVANFAKKFFGAKKIKKKLIIH